MTNDFTQLFAGFQLPGSDKFQGLFADAGARSQELAAKSRNATENLTELAKANVEAIAEAGRIAAAGAKTIGQDVIASSRTGFEPGFGSGQDARRSQVADRILPAPVGTGAFVVRPLRLGKLEADRAGRQACRRSDPADLEPRQRQCRARQRADGLTLPRVRPRGRPPSFGKAAVSLFARQGILRRIGAMPYLGRPMDRHAILMTGDEPGRGDGLDEIETGVVTRTRPRTKKPSNYKVLMLNDDYTPMEFVVLILQQFFSMSIEEATRTMLQVHQNGVAVCGVFTYEVAETKVSQVIDFARENQHPLQCTLEKGS